MPWFAFRYRNRSAEAQECEARQAARRRDSWEQMKAAVAAKYRPSDPEVDRG